MSKVQGSVSYLELKHVKAGKMGTRRLQHSSPRIKKVGSVVSLSGYDGFRGFVKGFGG